MTQDQSPASDFRAIAERLFLLVSYVHFLATGVATLLCIELLFCNSDLARDLDFQGHVLLPIGLAGIVNIPIQYWLRWFGNRYFHFSEHEAVIDADHSFPTGPGTNTSAAELRRQLSGLVKAIDQASVWDRPAARSAVKVWIIENRRHLDAEIYQYLQTNVGYLLPEGLQPTDEAEHSFPRPM